MFNICIIEYRTRDYKCCTVCGTYCMYVEFTSCWSNSRIELDNARSNHSYIDRPLQSPVRQARATFSYHALPCGDTLPPVILKQLNCSCFIRYRDKPFARTANEATVFEIHWKYSQCRKKVLFFPPGIELFLCMQNTHREFAFRSVVIQLKRVHCCRIIILGSVWCNT